MTTIQQLPTYPSEMDIYIPPPPLPFCDNFKKYNGNIFWGLLPYEIEDMIMKILFEMYRIECVKEFQHNYLRNIIRGEMDYHSFKVKENELEKEIENISKEILRVSGYLKRHQPHEHNKLGRSIKIWKRHNGNEHKYRQESILTKWRERDYMGYYGLRGDCIRPIKSIKYSSRFSRDAVLDNWENDYNNSFSDSWLVMNINMKCSIRQLKDFVKENFYPNQIKVWFKGLSKYKAINKNELIKRIYNYPCHS